MKKLVEEMNISQAVCESRDSDRIIRFMTDDDLSIDFILAYQNGDVLGVYYDDEDNLVYEDYQGVAHPIYDDDFEINDGEDVLVKKDDPDWARDYTKYAYVIINGVLEHVEFKDNTSESDKVAYHQAEGKGFALVAEDDMFEHSAIYYTDDWDDFVRQYGDEDVFDLYTYDVIFNDNTDSNRKGFKESKQYCMDYIEEHNGTDCSYFEDYKDGTVSVVCNETGETVYEETVR